MRRGCGCDRGRSRSRSLRDTATQSAAARQTSQMVTNIAHNTSKLESKEKYGEHQRSKIPNRVAS